MSYWAPVPTCGSVQPCDFACGAAIWGSKHKIPALLPQHALVLALASSGAAEAATHYGGLCFRTTSPTSTGVDKPRFTWVPPGYPLGTPRILRGQTHGTPGVPPRGYPGGNPRYTGVVPRRGRVVGGFSFGNANPNENRDLNSAHLFMQIPNPGATPGAVQQVSGGIPVYGIHFAK
jgi:hypothetical protein